MNLGNYQPFFKGQKETPGWCLGRFRVYLGVTQGHFPCSGPQLGLSLAQYPGGRMAVRTQCYPLLEGIYIYIHIMCILCAYKYIWLHLRGPSDLGFSCALQCVMPLWLDWFGRIEGPCTHIWTYCVVQQCCCTFYLKQSQRKHSLCESFLKTWQLLATGSKIEDCAESKVPRHIPFIGTFAKLSYPVDYLSLPPVGGGPQFYPLTKLAPQ